MVDVPHPEPDPSDRSSARLQEVFRALVENPFRLLGLTPQTSPRDVEREGGKLLSILAAGLDDPTTMPPLGPRARTPEQVRWAIAELRDPHRRALHEFFWPACTSLPIDPQRLEALLDRLPKERPGDTRLVDVLRDLAGELIPEPRPYTLPPEIAQRLAGLLQVPPRTTRVPELCPDALDLPGLFPLGLEDGHKDKPNGQS